MKKKIILFAAGVVLLAATVTTFVCTNRSNDPMDDLFKANVEALASYEGLPVRTCYIENWTGEYGYALFCDTATSESMIYPCSNATQMHGHKTAQSKCYGGI